MKCPIEMEALGEIMDDDEELIKECFEDFIDDYEDMLGQIESAISAKDPKELEKKAHHLKGSLLYIAAKEAAEIALRIENMGRENELAGAPEVLASMKEACNELIAFMREYSTLT